MNGFASPLCGSVSVSVFEMADLTLEISGVRIEGAATNRRRSSKIFNYSNYIRLSALLFVYSSTSHHKISTGRSDDLNGGLMYKLSTLMNTKCHVKCQHTDFSLCNEKQ